MSQKYVLVRDTIKVQKGQYILIVIEYENFIKIFWNSPLELTYKIQPHVEFWCSIKKRYWNWSNTIKILLSFITIYHWGPHLIYRH